jgi:hypothetical protein
MPREKPKRTEGLSGAHETDQQLTAVRISLCYAHAPGEQGMRAIRRLVLREDSHALRQSPHACAPNRIRESAFGDIAEQIAVEEIVWRGNGDLVHHDRHRFYI